MVLSILVFIFFMKKSEKRAKKLQKRANSVIMMVNMSKKYKIILGGTAFALVAIVVGLCLVFLGNKSIRSTPNSLDVQKVDGDYLLVTEYNAKYNYQFKLEQFIEGEYLTVNVVDSTQNSIKIADCNLNLDSGGNFRFSARYINESGGGNGKFCAPFVWSPPSEIGGIDYQNVTFENDTLSWEGVREAGGYEVIVVGDDLKEKIFPCEETSCDLSELVAGRYTVYIVAQAKEGFSGQSEAGAGKQIVVERQNSLSRAVLTGWSLSVSSSLDVLKFEVYADSVLLGTLDAGNRQNGVYTFENCQSLFGGLDVSSTLLQIKSLKNDCVLESELVEIVLAED